MPEREKEIARRRATDEARAQIMREREERARGNAEAMQDPQKKAMFDMMRKNFPDIPVTFKKDSSWRDKVTLPGGGKF